MSKALITLSRTGLGAGDLTFDYCKKVSDGSNVATAGFTLEGLGDNDYLLGLSVTEDTAFRVKETAHPEYFDTGIFERIWLWKGSATVKALVTLGSTGLVIGDLTWDYCVAVEDLAVAATTSATLTELGQGDYLLGLTIGEDVAFRVHVTADETYWDGGIFSPADRNVVAPSGATVRQQILNALAIRLGTILTANGYRTNLGSNVVEWDETPLDPDLETLRIEYRDEAGTTGYAAVGEHLHTLPVTLRILSQNNSGLALSNLRKACADVYQAIYADVTFGGLAQDANQDGDIREDYDEKADRAAGAEIRYVIEYTTAPGSP